MRRKPGLVVGLRVDATLHAVRLIEASRSTCRIELQGASITPGEQGILLIKDLFAVPVTAKCISAGQSEFILPSPLLGTALMYALAGYPCLALKLATPTLSSFRNITTFPIGRAVPSSPRWIDVGSEVLALRMNMRSG